MLTLEFEKVATKNGFDYYAIWDGTQWTEGTWVRVREDADIQAVEDAFYRNETVSKF